MEYQGDDLILIIIYKNNFGKNYLPEIKWITKILTKYIAKAFGK
jgi:hypothetical protein